MKSLICCNVPIGVSSLLCLLSFTSICCDPSLFCHSPHCIRAKHGFETSTHCYFYVCSIGYCMSIFNFVVEKFHMTCWIYSPTFCFPSLLILFVIPQLLSYRGLNRSGCWSDLSEQSFHRFTTSLRFPKTTCIQRIAKSNCDQICT